MNSAQTRDRILGFKVYFDKPNLVPYKAAEMATQMLQECGLEPAHYTIHPGHGSRREVRKPGQTYTRAEAIEEISRDDALSFFLEAVRGETEQTIHISKPFPVCPFQGFVVNPTTGLGIREFRSLVKVASKRANLAFGGANEGHYLAWQRCDDPDFYLMKYGSVAMPRIVERKEMPPPLDRRLDVSKNPGRISSVNKMPAFIAADMWLGPAFWKYAPCTKEEVLNEPWVEVEDTEYYLYVKAYPEPFTRPDGEQGRIQRRLWNVLFHQDCEWPPGSGGMSDVAVGGLL